MADAANNKQYSIYVGDKPIMSYVTAVIMQFTNSSSQSVVVKSRGKFISRAVDVIQVARERFLKEQAVLGDIKLNSEEFTNKEGKQIKVSTIEIELRKKQ